MVLLDDLKDLTLYKKSFFLPIELKNKRKGSAIMLLTPNYRSSIDAMNLPYAINKNYFESYYIEKSVTRYIKNESVYKIEDPGEYLFEISKDNIDFNDIDISNITENDSELEDLKNRDNIKNNLEMLNREIENISTSLYESSIESINTISIILPDYNNKKFLIIKNNNGELAFPSFVIDKNDFIEDNIINYCKKNINIDVKDFKEVYQFNYLNRIKFSDIMINSHAVMINKYISNNISNEGNYKFFKFMSVGELVDSKNINNLSKELKYFLARYGVNIFSRNMMNYVNEKFKKSSNIVYSGYQRDIDSVSKYFKESNLLIAFKNLEIESEYPKYNINIICSSDENSAIGYIDDRNISVLTPEAFNRLGYKFSYSDYIQYTAQLFAIYKYNHKVYYYIAESIALVLSGILDDIFKDEKKYGKKSTSFNNERLIKAIYDNYGIDVIKKIIKYNDISLLKKYEKELYSDNFDISNRDYLSLFKEDTEEKRSDINSLEDISDLGNSLKRKIRSQTVYKLNKIQRDLKKGNTGTETRTSTSLSNLKNNNVVKNNPVDVRESSLSLYKSNTHGDYIMEGNTMYLFEDNINYDMYLRNALYQDRFRSVKDVLEVYKRVKSDLPIIRYTYTDIPRYGGKNLFFDLSYYNESFFRNINSINDEDKLNTPRIMKIYSQLIERLIQDSRLSSYSKKTIFIPVLDWRHNNSMRMWMYREDLNPISIIYNMIRTNRSELLRLFGNSDVVFLGDKNYFKINFRNTDFSDTKNITKFVNLIKRIIQLGYYSPADPDPEDEPESSPSGIALNIINKVEKSQNVDISDVSGIRYLNKTPNVLSKDPNSQAVIDNIKKNNDDIAVKNNIKDDNKIYDKNINISSRKETLKNVEIPKFKNGELVDIKNKDIVAKVQKTTQNVSTNQAIANTKVKDPSKDRAVNAVDDDTKKSELVKQIAKVANISMDEDDALNKLDNDEFKAMILALGNSTEDNVNIDKTRSSKINQINDEFQKTQVAGKSVKDLLNENPNDRELPKTSLPVASINEDWNNLTFMNFDKAYDPDSDIIKMLDSMKNWTYPVAVKNVEVVDNSTSEDVLDLWTINCVDYKGTKFTIKVDIPKFVEGNFLKLRGNEKTIMIQSVLVPVIKTNTDECQIIGVGGYNKIIVRKYGNSKGKSTLSANKFIKGITKGGKDLKIIYGDNTKISDKYELPIDYIDISKYINSVESKNYKIYFNQDELRLEYNVDDSKGIPIGIQKNVLNPLTKTVNDVILYFSDREMKMYRSLMVYISNLLKSDSESFADAYDSAIVTGTRYSYSEASILSTKIPMIIILGYLEGLTTVLNKANIKYEFVQKLSNDIRHSDIYDYIEFSNGYLVYEITYEASMLLNGLKRNDTESYSIEEINKKQMYLDFLESYGGVIKSDGLENSYDCMIDPITKEILEIYKLPTDYVGLLIHANNLLADNKYVRHVDQSVRRWRRKELIAGYFYKALSTSYQAYANTIRHTRKTAKMTMKQSAVIDLILSKDPSTNDLSINNVINDVECTHTVTNKGLVGLNTDRAYSIDKRTYDDSMLNIFGMDTNHSGNVGVNRQATIDANVQGSRGLLKTIGNDPDKLSIAKTMTITEALTPLGSTHDDPPRTLMTYVQASKHTVRCDNNDPLLITNGADEAMPYLTSDIFAFKAKKNGKVIELVQNGDLNGRGDYMVVEYEDGSHDIIDLAEEVKKNSDGGYNIPLKLDTEFRLGQKFKAGAVLAYDKLSFSRSLGESGNLAANVGTLAKIALITTDEGFEDSAAITSKFADRIGTQVIMPKEVVLDKGSNIRVLKSIGDTVTEGQTIMTFQADFDDEAANALLKNLTISQDELSELGRKPVTSKYSGTIVDIKVYRTVELDELSDSLREFVEKYEKEVNDRKDVYKKYGLNTALLPPTEKIDQVGKAKNINNGVKIIFYIKYTDRMSVGDKITYYSANKGIIKYIIPEGQEPYTEFRKDEPIDSFLSVSSCLARMTCSNIVCLAIGKLMVELDRSVKDILGIKYDTTKL